MRIEAYTQVQQLYKAQKVKRTQGTQATGYVSDQLHISNIGRDFQVAKTAVANAPDVREDLTAQIKTSIQNGTYAVDNGTFAEKLLQKYEEMR